ncbi:hypothetical protein [Lysinibacillus sp. RC79]|uniref:hypothetical protein n=1 Tax=Lysinibacillus sp. RC79 TaxID=3156296 RepID=UPI0035158481
MEEKFVDVVVLGDNLTAITSSILLVKRGFSVQRIGEHPVFDQYPCFPLYHQDADQGILGSIIKEIDLTIPVKPINHIDNSFFPDFTWKRTRSLKEQKNLLLDFFPEYNESINEYFNVIEGLGKEWSILLESNGGLNPKEIPYSIRYSNLSYVNYIESLFNGNQKLIGILCISLPSSDVALTVMAGYLYGQVFDSCIIDGGIQRIYQQMENMLREGNVSLDKPDIPIIITQQNPGYKVQYQKNLACFAKCVLDTRGDMQNKSSRLCSDSKLTFLSILLELKEEIHGIPHTEIWYDYPDYDLNSYFKRLENGILPTDIAYILWNTHPRMGRAQVELRIDIPLIALGDREKYNKIIHQVLEKIEFRIPNLKDKVANIEIFTPEMHAERTHLSDGSGTRWAFSVKQVFKNPMKLEVAPKYFSTHDWGFAWFSVAYIAANQITAKLKNVKESMR